MSDVVMYWREDPVVGVDDAELPQFSIEAWATNERKIKLATGTASRNHGFPFLVVEGFWLVQ